MFFLSLFLDLGLLLLLLCGGAFHSVECRVYTCELLNTFLWSHEFVIRLQHRIVSGLCLNGLLVEHLSLGFQIIQSLKSLFLLVLNVLWGSNDFNIKLL